jgi:hypothetical protein
MKTRDTLNSHGARNLTRLSRHHGAVTLTRVPGSSTAAEAPRPQGARGAAALTRIAGRAPTVELTRIPESYDDDAAPLPTSANAGPPPRATTPDEHDTATATATDIPPELEPPQ